MRFLCVVSLLVGFITAQTIEFTSPASSGDVGEYSQNPTFVLGSVQNIQWTSDTDLNISLVLCQNRPNDVFEYVFSEQSDITSFKWNVGTEKSLSNGNVFFFEIFIAGETAPSAISHYFNLTSGASDTNDGKSSSTSTPSSASTSSANTSSATTNNAASITSEPTSSGTPTPSPEPKSDGGLSTGAKVGLGVGIPIAIALGLFAGWFFFGRKRKENPTAGDEPLGSTYSTPHFEHAAPNAMSEQASGAYKPTETPYTHSTPTRSEIYTPPQEAAELPSGTETWR